MTTFGQEKKGADLTEKGADLTNSPIKWCSRHYACANDTMRSGADMMGVATNTMHGAADMMALWVSQDQCQTPPISKK